MSIISKILFLVKNFTQDKNGTKPQENKYKNALDWKCLCGAFAPSLQKYEFVPSKTNILSYFSHLQTIFFEAFSSADNAGRFHSSHTLCCLFSGLAECLLNIFNGFNFHPLYCSFLKALTIRNIKATATTMSMIFQRTLPSATLKNGWNKRANPANKNPSPSFLFLK